MIFFLKAFFSVPRVLIYFFIIVVSSGSMAQTWEEVKVINATIRESNDKFGGAVSLSDKYGIVGAAGDDQNSLEENELQDAGSAYIIVKSEQGLWEISQKITASNRAGGDKFGSSVSISGEWAVVGAPYHDCQHCESSGVLTGAVYVFHKNIEGVWEEKQILMAGSNPGFWEFGSSVAIRDNLIVIGAYEEYNGEMYQAGAAYLFELNENNIWEEVQKLQPSDPSNSALFGFSVDVGGDTIIVGAPNGGDTFGAVYYYVRDGSNGNWNEKMKILPEPEVESAGFGYSLSLSDDGTVTAIGFMGQEKVYVYETENDNWILRQILVPEKDNGGFGKSVSVNGNFIVVGSNRHGGLAYVYEKNANGIWEETFKIYPSGGDDNDEFGRAVSCHGDDVLIGAPFKGFFDEYQKSAVGSVYIFRVTDIPYAFEETNWLEGVDLYGGHTKLIDFDNDGDLDLFLSYYIFDENVRESRLFENKDQVFEPIDVSFPHLTMEQFASWVNVDGDEFLDLVIGYERRFKPEFKIYLNNGDKTFNEDSLNIGVFENYWQGGFHFADFDNDMDLDILTQGYDNGNLPHKIKILENDGDFNFHDSNLEFEGWIKSSEPWCDFNSDGLIDFMALQEIGCDKYELIIYKNNGNKTFEKIETGLTGLNGDLLNYAGDMRWEDFDNDGDYDIVLAGEIAGCSSTMGFSNVYINNGNGNFYSSEENFGDLNFYVHLVPGDFNNDGQSDLFSYGRKDTSGSKTELLINENGNLVPFPIRELLDASQYGSISAGDIDGDGDLDIVIAGNENYFTPQVAIFKNNSAQGWSNSNKPPKIPVNLNSFVNGNEVILSWDTSSDDHTPTTSLSYNIYVYRNDTLVVESYSNFDGSRKIPGIGNVYDNSSIKFKNLEAGFYRWSVQAIDQSYAGSEFADEQIFIVGENALDTNNEDEASLTVFPNPTSGRIILFGAPLDQIERFHIKDITGTQVSAGMLQNRYLSVDGLKNGVYILTLTGKEFIEIRKIIKQ